MSLVDDVSEDFDVSENDSSTCVLEEATYPFSCVIVSFSDKFAWSAVLIMAVAREQIFFVGGSDTTYDATPLWVS